jgi:CheY-like chemotaxis protein
MTTHETAFTAALPPLAGICVLVVEDMPDELRLLARLLVEAGARVLTAVEGTEALRLARLMRPDLVLLDVQLPPPDGFSVCRSLRAQAESAQIPVLFISGSADLQTKLQGFAAGGRDFMTKPFTAEELVARVALHADLGRRLTALEAPLGAPRWLSLVLQRLQASLGQPPGLEQLAQEVGSSAHRLQEAFRLHLQTTPAAWVREARLREAARQLRDGSVPVAELGAALGYANPANFATAFRERFGVSPRQYRQNPDTAPASDGPRP